MNMVNVLGDTNADIYPDLCSNLLILCKAT